jgi:cytoskeleton protein RodZ
MPREDRVQTKLAMTMAEDRQADFGTFLRLAREQRGLTLQELAVTTKISARVLEALERNDPSKLPGGIFSRAFVRAYAREVGLESDATVARFVAAFPDEAGADEMPATTNAVEAESFELRRRIVRVTAQLLGVALIVAFLLFIYYSRVRTGPAGGSAAQGDPPAASARQAAATAAPGPTMVQPPATTAIPSAASGSEPAAAGASPAAVQGEPTAPAAPGGLPEAEAAARPAALGTPLAVVLAFTEPCWVSLSVDGTRAPSRTAAAGERLEFMVQRSITMTVGNAGAVSLLLNGKAARPLGAAGQVVTTTVAASSYESLLR